MAELKKYAPIAGIKEMGRFYRHVLIEDNYPHHGAVAFGPVVRSHEHDLNKKIRKLGLKCALSAKVKDGKLFILDEAKAATPKTKELKNTFDKLGWTSALILGGAELDKNFALASGNIVGIDVLADAGANVYDILRRDTLVLTKETVSYLEALLK